MNISDVIVNRSKEIIAEKREVLLKGDVAMAHQVGEGKDLMSICCKHPPPVDRANGLKIRCA